MTAIALYPLNDNAFKVQLFTVTSPGGVKANLTTGTVTGFLATSDAPTAVAADDTLTPTIVYTGSGAWWLVTFNATALTAELLAEHFATATPWCIIVQDGGIRVAVEMEYQPSKHATIADPT